MSRPQTVRFTLTADHIKLIRRMYIRWEDAEYGAPAVDCKRPYGNSSVEMDIHEILGWPFDEDEGLTEAQETRAREIHQQTRKALQIVLQLGTFDPGVFTTDHHYGFDWTRES